MLSPFSFDSLNCCNIPGRKVLLPFHLQKNKAQRIQMTPKVPKPDSVLDFIPRIVQAMRSLLHLTASCWHARSLPVVGVSEMVHTQPMHCSYTSCLGCLDLSSLIIMGRNGYVREISPFPPKAQDRDGPSHWCFFPLASGTRRGEVF